MRRRAIDRVDIVGSILPPGLFDVRTLASAPRHDGSRRLDSGRWMNDAHMLVIRWLRLVVGLGHVTERVAVVVAVVEHERYLLKVWHAVDVAAETIAVGRETVTREDLALSSTIGVHELVSRVRRRTIPWTGRRLSPRKAVKPSDGISGYS